MARFVEGYRGNKLAVTVLLVRDGAYGLEVYVQERVSSMPTFPKATVFPGGGVDRSEMMRRINKGEISQSEKYAYLSKIFN